MAKNKKKIEYERRLKELKKKLKPYRNSRTVHLLRVITGSSSLRLDKYWESLESVLTGQYSPLAVQERIQSVVNMITENGEYNNTITSHSNSIGHYMMKEFDHLNFDSRVNVSDNVTHVEIDSKANVLGSVTHVNINSKANAFDNVTHVEIDSKANVLGDVRHVNIDSKASVFDNVRHCDIDSKANVLGSVTHGNINSNSNVVDNVRRGTIDLNANMTNRLKHLHIGSCNPACYKRL
ncbi:uncharacterized protein LOC132945090 [Metopolophium dirhodum]|uniref:uncharacterized protein LOC132945090 n=1 Tax=Metopolophium dirhodum TaxID=44670 RepID=UPI002990794A|nr:uncharacterized protein LOC132945090 [Metopolophium dirhodum]